MPLIDSTYTPKGFFKNGDINTIYASKFRKVNHVQQYRSRIELSDGDFIDCDWSFNEKDVKAKKLVIIFHGLEGNAQRPYILGLAKILNANNYDCVAVNLRGCSGEDNRTFRSYHSGATEDADAVIQHIIEHENYTTLCLAGFSLGGNLVLKYLGENKQHQEHITAAVAISVPVSLRGSLEKLSTNRNRIYSWNFLKTLRKKYKSKTKAFPEQLNNAYKKIKTLKDFDDLYTAPAHGFKDAYDYYEKSSSLQYLSNIKVPTFLLNAENDSFLNTTCYPYQVAEQSDYLHLEISKYGGHVGFVKEGNHYYSEERALWFLNYHT